MKLLKPSSCLIVEDDEDCRWILMRSLIKLDFRCEAARDGEHALELLRRQNYEVVITDLRMPKKHGFSLASEILREFGSCGPAVVVYTGIEEPKLVSQLLTMGVEDVCIKPMNPDILATKVMSVFNRRILSSSTGHEAVQGIEASTNQRNAAGADSANRIAGRKATKIAVS